MKDSYSFDIDDAGLDGVVRSRTATAYIRIFDRLGFDYVIVKATSGAMGGSESEEFLAKADGRRGHLRPLHELRLRRQRRGRRRSARPRPCRTTTRRPRTPSRRPDTPTIETLVDHLNEKYPRDDRPWAAGDTLKNVLVVLKHPDGTREPLAIGLPGDREVDQKRLEGQLEPTEVEPMDEAEFAQAPRAGQGLHRPRRAGGEDRRPAIRYLVDPRVVEGTRWVTGADVARQPRARPRRRPRLHPRRHDRGRRGARRRPLPELRRTAPSRPRAASRWATSSSSAASTPRRSDLKVLDENGKLVTVTMGSYGIGVSARRRRDRRGHPRRARPVLAARRRARRRPRRRRPARTRRSSRPPPRSPTSSTPPASRCSTTTAPQGQPRREVQGRRADRRARRSSPSAAAWPTASSRSRTAAPASARRSAWPRPPAHAAIVRSSAARVRTPPRG